MFSIVMLSIDVFIYLVAKLTQWDLFFYRFLLAIDLQ